MISSVSIVSRRCFVRAALGFLMTSFLKVSTKAEGSNIATVDLATTLESFLTQGKIPGMAALVLRGDQIIAQGATGLRKKGVSEQVTLNDRFHLGSCTKAMTGTLAAMLVEEGKLNWSTTLEDLFGDTVKGMQPAWKRVTLQQVLAHRAGLPSGNDPAAVLDPGIVASEKSILRQRQIVVESQLLHQPEIPPGTKWVYSNVGYIIAGAALEKITGVAWEDLMRERIFNPLGITTGGFGAPGTVGKVDQPWGHDEEGNPIDPGSSKSDNPQYYGPCASVHMTITDWAKFVALHLRGDSANPSRQARLLKPATFDELHRAKASENYSAGWGIGTIDFAKGRRPGDKGIIFGHEGSNGLWYSKVLVAPEIDLAVLVVCNRGGDAIGGKAVPEASLALSQRFSSGKSIS